MAMSPDVEQQLAEYVGREHKKPTRDVLMEAFDKVSQGLQQHSIDCTKRWEENGRMHSLHISRLEALEGNGVSKSKTRVGSDSTPPMRAESPSYHDAVEEARRETERRVKEEANKSPGPQIDTDAAVQISTDVFTRMMAEREEAVRQRAELERLQALDAADKTAKAEKARVTLKWKRLWRYGLPAAFLIAMATAAGGIAVGTLRGHALGRAEVMSEVQAVAREQVQEQLRGSAGKPTAPPMAPASAR